MGRLMKTLRDRYREELVRRFEQMPTQPPSASFDGEPDLISTFRFRRQKIDGFFLFHDRPSHGPFRRSHS
jgi:hypothetical protein